jgi:hypothetical protein
MTPTENPKEYIITEKQMNALRLELSPDIMEDLCSRPVSTPPIPDSTHLIEMAKTEWKNREERRGIHNREDWCCGWMAGFLSVDKPDWSKEHDAVVAEKAREEEREKVLKENLVLIRDVISKDQSGLAEALAKIQTLAKGYDWIPDGEWGSYDYTQHTVETLQKECGYLLTEIEKLAYEGLRDSGNRVIAHVRFCDESLRQHKEGP